MEPWERYEDAAREAIRMIAKDLGIDRVVDEKKEYNGECTPWELDVTAFAKGTEQLIVFECRKRGRKVEKGEMAAFAFTVSDLGAKGYIVSQRGLGKGAKQIAEKKGIDHMQFTWNEETGDLVLKWLNNVYATTSDTLDMQQKVSAENFRGGESIQKVTGD